MEIGEPVVFVTDVEGVESGQPWLCDGSLR